MRACLVTVFDGWHQCYVTLKNYHNVLATPSFIGRRNKTINIFIINAVFTLPKRHRNRSEPVYAAVKFVAGRDHVRL